MKTKTQSEVYFDTLSSEVSGANVIIKCPAANYLTNNGSIGTFQYSTNLGSSWSNCTLAGTQIESNLNSIPLNKRLRDVKIVWIAAEDLCAMEVFTNVWIKVSFYDRASQAGDESEDVILIIAEIDMRPSETILFSRPYPGEPDFEFEFKTLYSVFDIKTHFKAQVAAENDPNFSTPLISFMSESSQTGWTLDGGAFPATGADTETDKNDLEAVTFTHASLGALAEADYNIRVLRSLHDPNGVLPPTYPDNW